MNRRWRWSVPVFYMRRAIRQVWRTALFLCGWLVVRLNEGFPGRRNESATRALSRRRQAWNMRPAGEETRAAEVEPTWENGGFKLEKIVVNTCLTLSVAVNLRCPRVKVQRLV